MLTLQKLKDLEPHTIFDSGLIEDLPRGCNMTNTGKLLKWVACRGGIHDWSIYCQYQEKGWSDSQIQDNGEKVTDKLHIKRLVNCDDEAFKMYRY